MKSIGALSLVMLASEFNDLNDECTLSSFPSLRGRIRALAVFIICTRRRSVILSLTDQLPAVVTSAGMRTIF